MEREEMEQERNDWKKRNKNRTIKLKALILERNRTCPALFEIELYLVRQIPENMEGYTGIVTDLNLFIGVGHLLQIETIEFL